jgi:hypothetical protein
VGFRKALGSIVITAAISSLPMAGGCHDSFVGQARLAHAKYGLKGGEEWLKKNARYGATDEVYTYYIYLHYYDVDLYPDRRTSDIMQLGALNCLESRGDRRARGDLLGILDYLGDAKFLKLKNCLSASGDSDDWRRCRAGEIVPPCPL